MKKIRVTIWNENHHERNDERIKKLYPNGIHEAIKAAFKDASNLDVRIATMDQPEFGLSDDVLNNTDVLIWWAHVLHEQIPDEVSHKVKRRVCEEGMGFIPLHSAHMSKPFKEIVGTSGMLSWGANQFALVWNIMPNHPIAKGIPEHFALESEEMYGEPFYIPQPDELVFATWYKNGNIFRSGCCFNRGIGRIFYFQPGHEECLSYANPYVQKILVNAVNWAAPAEESAVLKTSCTPRKPVIDNYKEWLQ